MVDRYRDYDNDGRIDGVEEPVATRRPTTIRRVETEQEIDYGEAEAVVAPPAFSVGATFLGWCVASFLTLVFTGIAAALIAPQASSLLQDGAVTFGEAQGLGLVAGIALLLAIFLAYLIGGYTAGRISMWRGVLHGALVPVWTILFALIAAALTAGAVDNWAFLSPGVDITNFAGEAILGIVLTLAAMFGGAALGGMMGERVDEDDTRAVAHRRTARTRRSY